MKTQRGTDGAVVNISVNIKLSDLVVVDGKAILAKKVVVKPERSRFNSVMLVLAVTLAMIVNAANSTSFSMALPTIQKEMQVQESQLQWVISAFPLSSGCLLLVCGRLADLYGKKKAFSIGSVILFIFTFGCAFAKDVITLDILRAFQGIGSAAQIPASLGILAHAFPPSRARSLAFATFSAGAPIGGVFGIAISGVLIQFSEQTWRLTCCILAGITLISLILGLISIDADQPSEEMDKRVDWLGALLVTAGLVLIVFVLSQVELAPKKWRTPYIIALLISGVLLIAAFFLWQHYLERVQSRHSAHLSIFTPPPLLKPSIWSRASGRLGAMMAIAFTVWCAFISWMLWVQLYYQNYKHYTPLESVLRLAPAFISGILCNIFVGLVAVNIPIVWLLGVGTLSTTTACLLLALIDPNATYWAFAFPAMCLVVIGADFVFSAGSLFIAMFALPHEQSLAGALFNTMTQLGTAVGVTVTTVVFYSVKKSAVAEKDNLIAYRAVQWTTFGFGAIATIIGILAFRGVGAACSREPPQDRSTFVSLVETPFDEESKRERSIDTKDPLRSKIA